jgi:hypothetical protein
VLRLVCDGQHHLQMRLSSFAAGDVRRHDVEPGAGKHATQGPRREAGMALAVPRGDLVLFVSIEAQENESPPRAKHARAFLERSRWPLGVRQGVKYEHRVEAGIAKRQLVNVGNLGPDVSELAEPLFRGLDHAGAGVDAHERTAVGRERPGRSAVPRSDIEHVPELQECGDADGEGLPGAAGRVVSLELVGDGLGKSATAQTSKPRRETPSRSRGGCRPPSCRSTGRRVSGPERIPHRAASPDGSIHETAEFPSPGPDPSRRVRGRTRGRRAAGDSRRRAGSSCPRNGRAA